jgi:Family of unknown function (DUF5994)
MTHQEERTDVGRHPTPPDYTPRLRLKPKAPRSGYVDGAWWPWSDDLTSELPDLLAVLSVRLGRIERVMYNLGEWATAPAKATLGERVVRLDGYPAPADQHPRGPWPQSRQDHLVGGSAKHRVRPGARHDDGRCRPNDDSSTEGLLTAGI